MRVCLLNYTKNCEELVAKAAKLCYSDSSISDLIEKVDKQDIQSFIKKIISIGHHSVLEHISFSFGVEGISRVCSHQLVRHRVASYSQQSQRYVKLDKTFEYITPDSIKRNISIHNKYKTIMDSLHSAYKDLLDVGIPAEDARFVLPNATETKIFITMNARELLHFFTVRCCNRAQWEIRAMAIEMLKEVKKVSSIVFQKAGPNCVQGQCQEGTFSCGNAVDVRQKFINIGLPEAPKIRDLKENEQPKKL